MNVELKNRKGEPIVHNVLAHNVLLSEGGGTLKEWIDKMGADTFDQLWDMACKQMNNCGSRNPQLEKPYELGGVRLTREEAMYSFVKTAGYLGVDFTSLAYSDTVLKATFPLGRTRMFPTILTSAFEGCSNLEVVQMCISYLIASNYTTAFMNCKKLREIKGVLQGAGVAKTNTFLGCAALEEVRLFTAVDVSFADSPLLSYESLEYLVKNASNTGPITVTVHADVYAKLTGGEGSEQRWQQLFNDAQAKQIAFVSG